MNYVFESEWYYVTLVFVQFIADWELIAIFLLLQKLSVPVKFILSKINYWPVLMSALAQSYGFRPRLWFAICGETLNL